MLSENIPLIPDIIKKVSAMYERSPIYEIFPFIDHAFDVKFKNCLPSTTRSQRFYPVLFPKVL